MSRSLLSALSLAADWGETLSEVRNPQLFLLNVLEQTVQPLAGVPAGHSLGQVVFSPDGKGVVFVARENAPCPLGVIYFNTRPSKLYYLELNGSGSAAVLLTPDDHSAQWPRFRSVPLPDLTLP